MKKNPQPTTFNPQFVSGFTLIEILVSIAVVFILIGVTFAGYASLNQRQQLLSAGHTVKNVLRDAQSRAGSGEVDCSVCNCSSGASAVLSGWYADFTSRTIYGKCATTIFPASGQSFGIAAEITIVPHLTPPSVLTFKTFPPGTDQAATICLSHKNLPGQYFAVRINKAGQINDDGTLIATCVPTP